MYYYSDFKELMLTRKRKLMHNTYMVNLDGPDYPKSDEDIGDIGIRFHNTIVLVHHPDCTVTLRCNKYTTQTTFFRINTFQNVASIWSRLGNCYVSLNCPNVYPFEDGMRIIPSEGIAVDSLGKPLDFANPEADEREYYRRARARRRKFYGVRRLASRKFTVEDWVACLLDDGSSVHYIHNCEENTPHNNAARNCKEGKRCPHCKTIVPQAFLMATQLQKLG